MNKKYTWSFMGQVHAQGIRSKMINDLKFCKGEYYCNVASGWQSSDSLSTKEYKDILSNSIFIPCPAGNSSVDTFRLYEALEVGSIPIIEKSKYWKYMLKDHPLIEVSSWKEASQEINRLLENNQSLEEYNIKIKLWWKSFKKKLTNEIVEKINQKPKKIESLLKLSNPSVLNIDNKYYGVFRGEDFGEQIDDINSGKIGMVQSLIYTRASYWMKVFDEDLNKIEFKQLKFCANNIEYWDYYRIDAKDSGVVVIEDIRLIENSEYKNSNGDICAKATCTALTEKFWKGFPPYNPGLCEVNFTQGKILFLKMLCDLEVSQENQKNWMGLKTSSGAFTILSMFPLVYEFSKDGNFGINNKNLLDETKKCEWRNSCQPILFEENKYVMLCHQKDNVDYKYNLVKFSVNNDQINIISSESIDIPNKNSYCSGIILNKKLDSLFCFAGVNNFSYEIYDLEISPEPEIKIDKNLENKKSELTKLKNEWVNFKDYDFLKYIHQEMPKPETPKEKFSVYNPGKSIAIVSLYTPEISDYAVYSEQNIKKYCEKNNYTFYVYREKIEQNSSPNWSKAQAILNHFDDHDDIVWMDSDTLVFNPEKRFEDILSRCTKTKKIVACEDIGTNNKNLPKGSMFNSGVIIFRNHNYTKNILKKWRDFNGDKSSLYASGGDQEILCEILKKSDGFGHNRKIFPMNQFNTEPRMINDETFIVHFMAYPIQLKTIFMKYFVSS
jgi:hypothetical protein